MRYIANCVIRDSINSLQLVRNLLDKMLRAMGKKARQVLREELLAGLQARGLVRREQSPSLGVYRWTIPSREAHTNSLYIHHTIGGVGRDSVAVTVGLLHALERLQPGIGYFRPIDQTTIGGHRSVAKPLRNVSNPRDLRRMCRCFI